jgi:glyoxylate reductase
VSWKVLITASAIGEAGQLALDRLRQADCEVSLARKFGPLTAGEVQPLLDGMDAVLASLDHYSAAVLGSPEAGRLKIISRWGSGFDAIDLAAATERGIVVTYTPGMLDEAVADHAFALLLALARRVPEGHDSMRRGEWRVTWGTDVFGKTLGLLGCGRIGRAVARRAAGFNLRLLATDCAPAPEAAALGVQFVPLDELLAQSDFLSLPAALTPQSRGLIGETELRR